MEQGRHVERLLVVVSLDQLSRSRVESFQSRCVAIRGPGPCQRTPPRRPRENFPLSLSYNAASAFCCFFPHDHVCARPRSILAKGYIDYIRRTVFEVNVCVLFLLRFELGNCRGWKASAAVRRFTGFPRISCMSRPMMAWRLAGVYRALAAAGGGRSNVHGAPYDRGGETLVETMNDHLRKIIYFFS